MLLALVLQLKAPQLHRTSNLGETRLYASPTALTSSVLPVTCAVFSTGIGLNATQMDQRPLFSLAFWEFVALDSKAELARSSFGISTQK